MVVKILFPLLMLMLAGCSTKKLVHVGDIPLVDTFCSEEAKDNVMIVTCVCKGPSVLTIDAKTGNDTIQCNKTHPPEATK